MGLQCEPEVKDFCRKWKFQKMSNNNKPSHQNANSKIDKIKIQLKKLLTIILNIRMDYN